MCILHIKFSNMCILHMKFSNMCILHIIFSDTCILHIIFSNMCILHMKFSNMCILHMKFSNMCILHIILSTRFESRAVFFSGQVLKAPVTEEHAQNAHVTNTPDLRASGGFRGLFRIYDRRGMRGYSARGAARG